MQKIGSKMQVTSGSRGQHRQWQAFANWKDARWQTSYTWRDSVPCDQTQLWELRDCWCWGDVAGRYFQVYCRTCRGKGWDSSIGIQQNFFPQLVSGCCQPKPWRVQVDNPQLHSRCHELRYFERIETGSFDPSQCILAWLCGQCSRWMWRWNLWLWWCAEFWFYIMVRDHCEGRGHPPCSWQWFCGHCSPNFETFGRPGVHDLERYLKSRLLEADAWLGYYVIIRLVI